MSLFKVSVHNFKFLTTIVSFCSRIYVFCHKFNFGHDFRFFFSLFKVFFCSFKFLSIIVSLYPRIYVFVHNFKCLSMILGGQITKKSEQKPEKVDIIKKDGHISLE